MSEGPEWFAPKRYGYGSGVPISWQGWAVTLLFAVAAVGVPFLVKGRLDQVIAVYVLMTTIFLVISAKTTRGGWRWRWGDKD
jgi:hypothetical protein